ncbi:unnamed protein product [Musa hybrid cultivar]
MKIMCASQGDCNPGGRGFCTVMHLFGGRGFLSVASQRRCDMRDLSRSALITDSKLHSQFIHGVI